MILAIRHRDKRLYVLSAAFGLKAGALVFGLLEPGVPAALQFFYLPQLLIGLTTLTALFLLDRLLTEHKLANAAVAKWHHVFRHAHFGVALGSADGTMLEEVNPAFARMHGYDVEELTAKPIADVYAAGFQQDLARNVELISQEDHHIFESMHIGKDGGVFPALMDVTAIKDAYGKVQHLAVIAQDIRERKCAEQELVEDRQQLEARVGTRTLELAATNGQLRKEITERKNAEEALQLIVRGTASLKGGDFFRSLAQYLSSALDVRYAFVAESTSADNSSLRTLAFWNGDDFGGFEHPALDTPCQDVLKGETCHYPDRLTERFPRAQPLAEMGAESCLGVPLWNSADEVIGLMAILDTKPMEDRSRALQIMNIFAGRAAAELERKQAEGKRQQSEDRFRLLVETTNVIPWERDLSSWRFTYVGPQAERLGYSMEEWLTEGFWEKILYAADRDGVIQLAKEGIDRGGDHDLEYRVLAADGSVVWMRDLASVIAGEGGPKALRGFLLDVTARRRAEETLRSVVEGTSSVTGANFFESLVGRLASALQTKFAFVAEYTDIPDKMSRTLAFWASGDIGDNVDFRTTGGPCEQVLAGELLFVSEGVLDRFPNNETLRMMGPESYLGVPLVSSSGAVIGHLAVMDDKPMEPKGELIPILKIFSARAAAELERKQTEETLHKQEEALRQSQKMEALGTLAGGLAHDYNNLMSVITLYSEILADRVDESDSICRDAVDEIEKVSERAASLGQQLLAFSRKQVLEPKVLDLAALVSETKSMLRRLLSEDIDLHTSDECRRGTVMADEGQIQQILFLLAANARDAMISGGRLSIETKNAEISPAFAERYPDLRAGSYVSLIVSDTGAGMDASIRDRVFEPFFTTKAKGSGTGLGLATVYGIVNQSGGAVVVNSEPGQGTSFNIYLPRVDVGRVSSNEAETQKLPDGSETILLVEDENALRRALNMALTQLGYKVLEADSGMSALTIAAEYASKIDLVVTDVVMPKMSGPQLVKQLPASQSGARVIYISGHADEAITGHGVFGRDVAFLAKPFSSGALARKIRKVLDGGEPHDPAWNGVARQAEDSPRITTVTAT